MLTLKTYAHAMSEEETDLSFAEFAVGDSPERPDAAPDENEADDYAANPAKTWWS
jgi:hypothetical protein